MFQGVNPRLRVRASAAGGVFSRQDALECGYSPEQIRRRLADKRWLRVKRGYYTDGSGLAALTPWDRVRARHRSRVHAVVRSLRSGQVAVSHASALVLHGVDVWGIDLGTVHVTRIDGRCGRTRPGLCQHVGKLAQEDLTRVGGLLVTAPARAVVETACVTGFESAVVSADAALRSNLVRPEDARRLLREMLFWPGGPVAREALRFASGRSESVGESRLRVIFERHELPVPELQATLQDGAGTFIGRVDFYFRTQRVVVEFDGRIKYHGDTRGVVLAEKAREDRLREQGLIVVRVTWDELDQPELLVRRVRQAFERATD